MRRGLKGRVDEARAVAREMTDPARSWPEARYETRILLGLFALAFVLRAVYARWNYAMFDDGPAFIYLAQMMEAGRWADAFAHEYHPLYSYLTHLVYTLVPDWERAGVFVSVLAGSFSLLAVYGFFRHSMGLRAAWIGALLYAVHPLAVMYSADVQSEGLYFLLFFSGVAALWRAFDEAHPGWAALAGVCSALAYLTRPEGAGIALLGAGFAGVAILRRQWSLGRGVLWMAALCLAWLLVAGPYLVTLKEQAGHWTLTKKKSVAALALLQGAAPPTGSAPAVESVPPSAPPKEARPMAPTPAWEGPIPRTAPEDPDGRGPLVGVADVFREVFSAARLEVLLAAFGLGLIGFAPGRRGGFLLAFASLYFAMFVSLRLQSGYISGRHVLPLIVLSFGYVALGLPLLGSLFAGVSRRPRIEWVASQWMALGLGLVVLISLGRQIPPHRASDLAERRVAEWFQREAMPEGLVLVGRRRVAFYAGVPYNPISALHDPREPAFLKSYGVRYAILEEEKIPKFPIISEMLSSGIAKTVHCEAAFANRACLLEFRLD